MPTRTTSSSSYTATHTPPSPTARSCGWPGRRRGRPTVRFVRGLILVSCPVPTVAVPSVMTHTNPSPAAMSNRGPGGKTEMDVLTRAVNGSTRRTVPVRVVAHRDPYPKARLPKPDGAITERTSPDLGSILHSGPSDPQTNLPPVVTEDGPVVTEEKPFRGIRTMDRPVIGSSFKMSPVFASATQTPPLAGGDVSRVGCVHQGQPVRHRIDAGHSLRATHGPQVSVSRGHRPCTVLQATRSD